MILEAAFNKKGEVVPVPPKWVKSIVPSATLKQLASIEFEIKTTSSPCWMSYVNSL